MRTHGRKRRILLHDSDFRGKFRIVQQFFLPKCGFPTYFIAPEPAFPTLFARLLGGVRCSTIPKNGPKKWNRVTFTEHRTCRNRRNHVTMARKTHSKLRFSCILMLRVSPIGNRNRESRKCRRLDRNDSYPDIEGDTSRRLPHVNRKHQGNG